MVSHTPHFTSALLLLVVVGVVAAANTKPPYTDLAATARWVAHEASWGVLSTTSARQPLPGIAFGSTISFADGTFKNGTGHLWFYTTAMDASMIDIAADNNCTFSLSEKMVLGACLDIDAEDPRCARVVFLGTWRNTTAAEDHVARQALFERHPAMRTWPSDHSFYTSTIDISTIWMLD